MDDKRSLTPVIAIVGRSNVGKSTMFNRLLERKKAIVSPTEGTTTDINFGHCHWRDRIFTVVDTAGLDLTSDQATDESIRRQAEAAMAKADLILFLVDTSSGILPQDSALARALQRSRKDVILVANKADSPAKRRTAASPEWEKLGFGRPLAASAANGSGVGDMLDIAAERLEQRGLLGIDLPEPDVRVAIIGRPNVGKSSLLNALAGEERAIVRDIPHTTKEPQDTLVTVPGPDGSQKHVLLIDTVGIRKRAKVGRGMEKIGVSLSIDELTRADVAVLIIDAIEGVGTQEKRLIGLIERKRCGVLIVVNKWDLAKEGSLGTAEDYKKLVMTQLPFIRFAPIAFISALTGNRVGKLLDHVFAIQAERTRQLSQEELDGFLERLKKKHHAVLGGGKSQNKPKVYGMTQVATAPPEFTVVVRKKETAHPNFLRFIENRLREDFGFEGTPIVVHSREIRVRT